MPIERGGLPSGQLLIERRVEALIDGQVVELAGGTLQPALQGCELIVPEFGGNDAITPVGEMLQETGLALRHPGGLLHGGGPGLGFPELITEHRQGGLALGDLAVQFLRPPPLRISALALQPCDPSGQFTFLTALGGHRGHGTRGLRGRLRGIAPVPLLKGDGALCGRLAFLLFAQLAQQRKCLLFLAGRDQCRQLIAGRALLNGTLRGGHAFRVQVGGRRQGGFGAQGGLAGLAPLPGCLHQQVLGST